MVDWGPHAYRIEQITTEWNNAEETIKLAEQVSHKVVWPAVKELRYAGRRIIEAFKKIKENKPSSEVDGVLQDAEFNCHRARHDAIDAATAKIGIDLETARRKIGESAILPVFPDFPKLTTSLNAIRKKISQSRKDRDNRDKIYAVLEVGDFSSTVDMYRQFLENEPIMVSIARKQRFHLTMSYAIGGGGIIVGIVLWFLSRSSVG